MDRFSFEIRIRDIFGENYCRKNFIAPAREEEGRIVFYSLHIDDILKYAPKNTCNYFAIGL